MSTGKALVSTFDAGLAAFQRVFLQPSRLTLTRDAWFILGLIWFLTLVNVLGMRPGTGVQVVSTLAKVGALGALVVVGLAVGQGPNPALDAFAVPDRGGLELVGVEE